MTISHFKCERCKGTTPRHSRRKGWMQRVLTPPPLVRYYRCQDCADRYPAIGFGERRVVLRKKAQQLARRGAVVVLCGGILAAIMGFFMLR